MDVVDLGGGFFCSKVMQNNITFRSQWLLCALRFRVLEKTEEWREGGRGWRHFHREGRGAALMALYKDD